MRRFLLYMLLLFISLPVFAAENEFKLGVTTATRYNDNISNVTTDKQDAFAFELGPSLRLKTRAQKYEGEVSYGPRFATYTQSSRNDDFSQNFGLLGEYHPTQRLTFGLREVLTYQKEADREFDQNVVTSGGSGDKETFRNRLKGETHYALTPRVNLSSNVGYNIVSRQDPDLSDLSHVSGRVQANYQATVRQTFGGGALAQYQTVDAAARQRTGDTATQYYGFFAYWSYRFTPLLSLSASGGPTWLISRRDGSPNGLVPSQLEDQKDTSVEYFASVQLVGEFEGGTATLAYERSASDFAFTSNSYLIDVVSAQTDWAVTPKITLGVVAEWNQRNAVQLFSGDTVVDQIRQWRGAATASYRLRSDLDVALTFDYQRQTAKDDGLGPADRYRGVIRFTYNPRPFRF